MPNSFTLIAAAITGKYLERRITQRRNICFREFLENLYPITNHPEYRKRRPEIQKTYWSVVKFQTEYVRPSMKEKRAYMLTRDWFLSERLLTGDCVRLMK